MSRVLVVRLVLLALAFYFLPQLSHSQHRFLENGRPISHGSDPGFLLDTPTRIKIDLSGRWNYSTSSGASGAVMVPSAYDFVDEVTFERTFELTADQLENYDFQIVMFGANYNTSVYINGDFVRNHVGGYTSFMQPVPANLLQIGEENVIKVTTNNQLDPRRTIPLKSQVWGWRNYGGILRDIFLLGIPHLYISDVVTESDFKSTSAARIRVTATLEGSVIDSASGEPISTAGFFIEAYDKISGISVGRSSTVTVTQDANRWTSPAAELTVQNPKFWSPGSPDLYFVKCFIVNSKSKGVIDEYDVNCGIRSVERSHGDILLNGKRFVMKGVVWHEDHPTWGSAMTNEEMEKDVVLMKNLGANVVRFANHPPHPYMLNLCDRYGLMALEEICVNGAPAPILQEEFFGDLAASLAKEMILRDRNHPSVLAWGLGDEFDTSMRTSRSFVDSLAHVMKQLDSRPTYYGSRMLANDVCSDLVDIAGLNVYAQDVKEFRSQLEQWKTMHPDQPVIVAKFGTEVQEGNHNGYSDPLSFEAQARFYMQRYEIIRSQDFDGAIVRSLNDWKGDRPALTVNSGDPWMHTMGLVSYAREKRLAYEAVRTLFSGEKFIALPIGNYAPSAPVVYVLSGLVILIGTAYFYNASRRFRENLNRSTLHAYNFFADVRDQRIVPLLHSTALGVFVAVAVAIVISSILYHFRENWILDNMLSHVLLYDNVKERIVRLIWNPLKFIGYCSLLLFVLMLAFAIFMMILAPLFKMRGYPYHAYTVTMWAMPPFLVFVPVGMILYRVMESQAYVLPALILFAALSLWVFLRLLKGIAIVYDVYAPKVFLIGLASVCALCLVYYFYLDYSQSMSLYVSYMLHVTEGHGHTAIL